MAIAPDTSPLPLLIPEAELRAYNTLGVTARAAWFASARSEAEVVAVVREAHKRDLPLLVVGGGSNLVLQGDYPGLVLHMATQGRRKVREDDQHVWFEVAAGENWHQLVTSTLAEGYSGLENLALIPGSVGAAPIQNIGAYGVELDSVFEELRAIDRQSGVSVTFDRAACAFGYRDSIFKSRLRDRYVITHVTLRLRKQPCLVLTYPALRDALAGVPEADLTPQRVAEAVCEVRTSKLPDPREIPNVGSFFKNPVVSADVYQRLKADFSGVVAYAQPDGRYKLAAGWLIDRAGWRGHTEPSGVGVHPRQALVITNSGHASGAEVMALAERIRASIKTEFGVDLEPEPTVVGW
ncbi:UDP-N-acetylmuramate dehydrogenase [Marinimicrobium alkaliphilum]|uniref:UDP-N-acetylmuramate dehydrogenase n=1 Tax=Marinimicrobium alkaliphilum TaxID=2202654 RepID=UPI001E59C885|nr:UDP-N-acetylmuramate dehydrogenase [Marinimicrobium alkaliphilum]